MDITQLNIAELADARERINERQRALEDAALATLEHRALHFAWRLSTRRFRRTTHDTIAEEEVAA